MSLSTLYPSQSPSMFMDFANTKQLDPRVSFTRTTTARYYDGVTVAKAEENLFRRSQEFDQSPWTTNGTVTVTANSVAAPDGTTTADTIDNTASAAGFRYQEVSLVIGQVYQWSIFVKNNTATSNVFQVRTNSTAAFIVLNWTGATLDSLTQTTGTATFSSVGNDWYRVVITYTAAEASTRHRIYGGDASTTGSAIYVWGAQLEQRSAVTAYTPTTTQPITNYIPVLLTATAGQPRFDHNPTTNESLGLLIEEQRTNLLQRSEEFENAYWSKVNATITANTIVAPDGTLTGDKLIPVIGATGVVQRTPGSLAAGVYTSSFFAKDGGLNVVRWRYSNSQEFLVEFNLSNLQITNIGATPTSTAIQSVGNGFYRCIVTITTTATRNFDYRIQSATVGNGYDGIFIWGAQVEAGAFPTSYIPTVASTMTRNADVLSMTGGNFADWYNAGEGTLYIERSAGSITSQSRLAVLNKSGTADNRIADLYFSSTTALSVYVAYEGVAQVNTSLATGLTGSALKLALGIAKDNYAWSVNAGSVNSDTSALLAEANQLSIGASAALNNQTNGTIKKLAYYPIRVSNTNLQALTT